MYFSNKYFVWSVSVDPVAHGTGTVGIVEGFALWQGGGCLFWRQQLRLWRRGCSLFGVKTHLIRPTDRENGWLLDQ